MEIRADSSGSAGSIHTLRDAVDRYIKTIVHHKRGGVFEMRRLDLFLRMPAFPASKQMSNVTSADIAHWRDVRLKSVSPSSVRREMVLLSQVFEVARIDWGWIKANPTRDVRKPPESKHRDRVITGLEVRKMLRVMGWRDKPTTATQALAHCFIAALQTGMRAGELCALRWDDVHNDYCVLHTSKTGAGRAVPLTPAAKKNIDRMRGFADDGTVFGLRSDIRDALFRKYRAKAGLNGFTFHDARHTAATRMAQVLHVLDLCKVFGWSNTSRALTYYNPKAGDLAARLAGKT